MWPRWNPYGGGPWFLASPSFLDRHRYLASRRRVQGWGEAGLPMTIGPQPLLRSNPGSNARRHLLATSRMSLLPR